MRETDFSQWLETSYRTNKGIPMDPAARASRISNCRRVEQYLGDLDVAYDTDGMESLLSKLELGRGESTARHRIPIDGDLYAGTATLRNAARLYHSFRASSDAAAPAAPSPSELAELDSQLRLALPNDSQRQHAAEFMARLIELAAKTIPEAWVLSWRQKRGIFLTLNFYRIFAIDRNRIFVAFTTSDASAELREAVEKARVRRRSFAGYRSIDDTTASYVSASFYFEHRESLDPLIEKLATRVAQKYKTTPFARFHSPAAVAWIEQQVGRDLASPAYRVTPSDSARLTELSELVDEFESWCSTDFGQAHLTSYAASRAAAADNLREIRAARAAGEEVTDRVLRGVLPHANTERNRARGAWTVIASAIAGDIRTKYRRSNEEWHRIAARILQFIEEALADPSNLGAACASFSESPESRSFQSGMLTPFLNAIAPERFAILNKKSRVATNYIAGTNFGQALIEYPYANEVIRATAVQIGELIDAPSLADVPDGDLYDAFCHWLVAVRRLFHEDEDEQPLFDQRALDLLALLERSPLATVYQEHRSEFRAQIEEPFRRLFAAVAERLTPEMLSALETERGIFSRFLKNDYGQGGAWPHYWGAFYPKGTRRVRGVQLFVAATTHSMTFGFYAAEMDPADPSPGRVVRYIRDESRLARDGFDEVLDKYHFGNDPDDATKTIDNSDDTELLAIRKAIEPEELTNLTLSELSDMVAESFRELFPLVQIALGQLESFAPSEDSDVVPQVIRERREIIAPLYPLEELSHDAGVDADTAAMWVRAIERKKQAIFYGPPGTGKTFLASRLARHLIGGADGFMETLQFHPAYSYEDFMEGIRPVSHKNGLSYPVVPGRFREFCDRARVRRGRCVLIIDEINRANLARVMGELMYLLEYRQESVPLASGTDFSIPSNVRIIGTMNTADRSIALVDHALRRRFAFIPLHPDYDVLRRFHQDSALAERLIGVLEEINRPIEPHYRIGISFFLVEPLATHLADIWRMEIEPYLEEYFFDQPERVRESRWEHIRTRLGVAPDSAEPTGTDDVIDVLKERDD